jgi:hypothetical protein
MTRALWPRREREPAMGNPARSWPALSLALSLLALSSAAAQKHCTKGIPCGNSCISASNVCHIGTSPPAASAPPSTDASRARRPAPGPWSRRPPP